MMAAAYYGASMFAMASAPRGIQPTRKPRLFHCLQQFVATSRCGVHGFECRLLRAGGFDLGDILCAVVRGRVVSRAQDCSSHDN